MTIGTRIILKDRKPLQTLLPLEAPLVLFIDPADKCCLKCSFCPTSNDQLMQEVKRPLSCMDFNLYKKIINDLEHFKTKIKVLRLYLHGEPLLNKHFSDMVRYAKNSGKIESVDTTTNGVCLNPKLNLELIKSGIDRINISVNGINSGQYKKFTGIEINFKKYVENIKHLFDNKKQCYIFIKINGDTISEEDEKTFMETFEPIADSVAVERSFSCWNGFEPHGFIKSDKNVGIYGQPIEKEVLVCPYPLYSISVQSSGKVSTCFLDWSLNLVIGDLNNEKIHVSIYDVWHSDKFKDFQKMMLKGKRKSHFYCKDCEQLKGGMPSDIDGYAEELLEKYSKM